MTYSDLFVIGSAMYYFWMDRTLYWAAGGPNAIYGANPW